MHAQSLQQEWIHNYMDPAILFRAGGRGAGGHGDHLTRFFDKVTRDGSASFDAFKDGRKYLQAVIDGLQADPVDWLFRLTKPKVARIGGSCTHHQQSIT